MNLKELGQKISKYAPFLGGVISVANPAAGAIVASIANAFGADPNPDSIFSKLNTDPEVAFKLHQLELDHDVELKAIALQTYQTQIEDVKSARIMQTANDGLIGRSWIVTFLVIASVIIFAACLAGAYFSVGPVNQMFLFLIGQQSGVYLAVYGFYFSGIDPKKLINDASDKK